MRAKNIISFLLVLVLIVAFAFVALFDVTIGDFRVPSTFDKELGIKQGLDLVGGSIIVFEPDVKDLSKVSSHDMDIAESIIRKRLDAKGYAEAPIARQNGTSIRVEIPNIDNPQEAVKMIGATAKLTFVDANGQVIMEGTKEFVSGATSKYEKLSDMGNQEHFVELSFTKKGQEKFKVATEAAMAAGGDKQYITIALDGKEQMSPHVNEVINSDKCVITGGYTAETAEDVAELINSGQLPFSLKQAELRSVGPTLGSQALNTSLKAALIGIILVMIFMLLIYRLPGLVASISLIMYTALITLVMAGFFIFPDMRTTLTLPGIAGVILSIGMAVDADVVIFERIKEELRRGKSVGAAVNAGFNRAITAVIDSNITTVIAAVVLYFFGTGTVKSFATTLFIGVVISMLTAVTLTKFLLKRIVGFGLKNPWLYGVSKKRRNAQ